LYRDSVGVSVPSFTAQDDLVGASNQTHLFAYVTRPWKGKKLLEPSERGLKMSAEHELSRGLRANLKQRTYEM